jgi:hypothetical protein
MFEKASTKTVQDLTPEEIKQAQVNLTTKIKHFKPKVVAFNGKSIYETYLGASVKNDFNFGKQPVFFDNNATNVIMFVLPSSSARCSQLPKVIDKVPFYAALGKLRDFLNGRLPTLTDMDVMFPDFKVALNTGSGPTNGAKNESDSEIDEDMDEDMDDTRSSETSGANTNKKHEHKIRFVRLNNLPYSQLPSNIIQSLNEQRKSKKGITITTNRNMFNVKGPKATLSSRKKKASSLSNSDMDTGSNLTNDSNSTSEYSVSHNNNNNNSCSSSNNNGEVTDKSNIGSIVLNLVNNANGNFYSHMF